MWWNYGIHNWGMRCKLTMCHNPKRKKIGLGTHTLEVLGILTYW